MPQNSKTLYAWAMYDWANSAYATAIMAGFFPIFFKQYYAQGADAATSTAWLGAGNAVASLLILLLAPILGTMADQYGARKRFLILFAVLGICTTGSLAFLEAGNLHLAITLYAFSAIGFSGANIFYDSLLPDITEKKNYEKASSLGYAMGYLGGGLLFLIGVLLVTFPESFGITSKATAIKVAFFLTALWWLLFSLPLLLWVQTKPREKIPADAWKAGIHQLKNTLQKIRQLKIVLLFLIAYWFYIDGVDTVAKMAVDFGLNIGLESKDLIQALLLIQFLAFPCTFFTYKIGSRIGYKKTILFLIGIYFLVILLATQMQSSTIFYLLALFIAFAQGGIQALSRALYARITPSQYAGEFFGFYNMFGKFAAILGPLLISAAALLFSDIRLSVIPIALLFIIGSVLLWKVDVSEGERLAEEFEA